MTSFMPILQVRRRQRRVGRPRSLLIWMLLVCGGCRAAAATPADQVYLRSGETLSGRVVGETPAEYRFAGADARWRRIPREAVRFVLYGDPATAERQLGLQKARRFCPDPAPVPVRFLPTEDLGRAILAAAQGAQTSIWIAAYYISGSQGSPIREFYETLEEKALAGLDVRIIVECGHGTAPSIKRDTHNFTAELARGGMKAFLLSERKPQHKKLLIVDGRLVILGSSNLTLTGTSSSNEMNVQIDSAAFVQQAIRDFETLQSRAIPLENWPK